MTSGGAPGLGGYTSGTGARPQTGGRDSGDAAGGRGPNGSGGSAGREDVAGRAGVAEPSGGSSATGGDAAGGDISATAGNSSTGGSNTTAGNSPTGGSNTTGGNSATGGGPAGTGGAAGTSGGDATGGSPADTGGAAGTGGDDATGGSNASGGSDATGGSPADTGGAAGTGGEAGAGGAEPGYLSEGVVGRIDVIIPRNGDGTWPDSAQVSASFFDQPMRMDAFAPFAPSLHEVGAEEGDCMLLVAAENACSPPCGVDELCAGSSCVAAPQFATAGVITVTGVTDTLTLSPQETGYEGGELPVRNLAANATITAQAAGGATPGFTLEASGVGVPSFDIENGTIELIDGQDNVITWTPIDSGIVELLLNSGWHGAPPEATLVCEAPASAGQLVIPQELVEAFPSAGGIGLFPHSSWLGLLQRARATVDSGTVELVVARFQGVTPIH